MDRTISKFGPKPSDRCQSTSERLRFTSLSLIIKLKIVYTNLKANRTFWKRIGWKLSESLWTNPILFSLLVESTWSWKRVADTWVDVQLLSSCSDWRNSKLLFGIFYSYQFKYEPRVFFFFFFFIISSFSVRLVFYIFSDNLGKLLSVKILR